MCPDFPSPPGGGATAAQVWAYGTRGLTGDPDNAIRDAILSDAIKIAGGDIAPVGEYDVEMALIDVAISTRPSGAEYTAARAAKMDKIQNFIEDAFGTLTATGAEDDIRESLVEGKLHAFIDLTAMMAGDIITIRQFMKIKVAGSYIKYADETFSGVQTPPMLYVVTKPSKHGIKITLEQTAGTNRDYDWETFIEKAAS